MKKRREFEEMLRRLSSEEDGWEESEPLRLVLRLGPNGLELTERDPDEADLARMMPREFDTTFVPGPDTIQ